VWAAPARSSGHLDRLDDPPALVRHSAVRSRCENSGTGSPSSQYAGGAPFACSPQPGQIRSTRSTKRGAVLPGQAVGGGQHGNHRPPGVMVTSTPLANTAYRQSGCGATVET